MRRPAVFLDRDGTINVEVDYLADPDQLELIPGAGEALVRLREAGFQLVVVTNQSGIARGMLDEATLARVHQRLDELLAEHGALVDAYYFCPHHPSEGEPPYRADCECRKPKAGMLRDAERELDLELPGSWIVGDSIRDLEAGAVVGVPGILVRTGKGEAQRTQLTRVREPRPEVAADLAEAATTILERDARQARQTRQGR